MEKWEPIKGYSGSYSVSSKGRIWSHLSKKFLAKNVGTHGYIRVNLRKDSKTKQVLVHRIVAEAFLDNNKGFPQVNHKDGEKTNNNLNNLEWCTEQSNTNHAYSQLKREGSRKNQFGADNPRSRKYLITNPDGVKVVLVGIVQYCEQNSLDASKMYAVAKGHRKHHKSFKCEVIKSGVDPA